MRMKTNFTTTEDVPARTADVPAKARMMIQTIGLVYYWSLPTRRGGDAGVAGL
jgi:hypothetical protein